MSDEINVAEKIFEEVLIDLMTEIVMSKQGISIGVHASFLGAFPSSPSTARAGPSRLPSKRRYKLRNDFATVKMIPSILPKYIPPLSDTVN
jgi:hypothetical protein